MALKGKLVGVNVQSPAREEVLTQLETLCSSKGLVLKLSLQKLLRHIVVSALDGKALDLKEQLIGIHLYGKFPDWNPKEDATVRVAMTKLRREVNTYYESDGLADGVFILLEPGSYIPEYSYRKPKSDQPSRIEDQRPADAAKDLPKAEVVVPVTVAAPPPQVIIIREVPVPAPPPPASTSTPGRLSEGEFLNEVGKVVFGGPIALIKWLRKQSDEK